MLRLTLERVGPDGTAKVIGHAVIGRWAGGHVAAVTDDRQGPHVGHVAGHHPGDGVWALVRDAVGACLDDGGGELSEQQLAVLERALRPDGWQS